MIKTIDDLMAMIDKYGFIPLFKNDIPGFSIEENTDQQVWFVDNVDGPWEWKGTVASSKRYIYGKFFNKKAGFITRDWFGDFLNYRRDGYDFDARFNDHLASYHDQYIYNLIAKEKYLLSTTLKHLSDHQKGLDTIVTRLQMQCYVIIANFEYKYDKNGHRYGWGIGEYSTPEYLLGEDFINQAYQNSPEVSYQRLKEHFQTILPHASEQQIKKMLG